MLKRAKRAFTLIELVVVISLTSIVLVGVGFLFFSTNKTNHDLTGESSQTSNARMVVKVLDQIIDEQNYKIIDSEIFDCDSAKEIGTSIENKTIFRANISSEEMREYVLFNNKIGYYSTINSVTGELQTIYSLTESIQLTIQESPLDLENQFEYTISYGKNFAQHMNLVKTIYRVGV